MGARRQGRASAARSRLYFELLTNSLRLDLLLYGIQVAT